ncbi:YhgE/Pip domain-containing protein [Viridibacillus sp. FSL R5-0477]|uniref:Phage infection protein n=1 Tax=Viridibacillus arenosi FSL R5-213 TaxID=1227360 RepID=W4EZJ5_9BACL|nr:YhgE/Pip domain-containing protein [Viridibacillus arenosi]ETT85644.1 phage infection protein [Viridibacillus arenosi FSL R5-213]
MKNIWEIYKRDIKSIFSNWVAAVILGGLIILPSLYAWLNIAASWDPYAKTSQIPVGIVNEDGGAKIQSQHIDAGEELVATLHKNNDMDWQFTNRKTAMEKVRNGDFFAVIIIPENFSKELATVVSDKPRKAEIEYYVNEKINSIAPKITSKGASVLAEEMSSKFIGTVNGTIFEMFNRIGIEMQNNLPDIEKFKNYVFTLEKDLPGIHTELKKAQKDANSASTMIGDAQNEFPQVKKLTEDGLNTIENTLTFLTQAEGRLNDMNPKIKEDLQTVQKISTDANTLLKQLQNTKIDFTEVNNAKETLDNQVTSAIDKVSKVEQALADLKQFNDENNIQDQSQLLTSAIERTKNLKALLVEAQTNARNINDVLAGKEQDVADAVNSIQTIAQNTSVELDSFIKEYTQSIEPTVFKAINDAQNTLSTAKNKLTIIQTQLPEVVRIINNTDGYISEAKSGLNTALGQYPYVNTKVKELANKIRDFEKETDLNSVIQLLINDPNAEKSFFEQPIKLNENALFPIKNYGTGMTPFYTVLSIWVGCLLLISLLSVGAKNEEDFTTRQIYFGKLLTFWTIGILQTLIITMGDLFILKVSAHNPVWFVLFCLFISLVFMSIVYTLVSVFGDVGKALAIVLLVLQLAGSGGTYPVVLLPKFFQVINPYLPFTYAIGMAREAIGGIIWNKILVDVIVLGIVLIIVLLFGAILKKRLNVITSRMLLKSRKSGLFH